jgi:2-polyprenyl-6-methoxyphenol hydroxylase-like FAD-dependent oxidoreductase
MLECVATNDIKNEKIIGTIWNADRFFDLGVYFHNPFSLAGWTKEIPSSGGSLVVLCGDAAHAMPPFLGQGSNQGIQDAFCLAQKIQMYNSQIDTESEQDLRPILKKEYEAVRWIPTTSITAKAAILGYLETGGRNGFYSKFRDLFFKTLALLGIPVKVLLDAATPKID